MLDKFNAENEGTCHALANIREMKKMKALTRTYFVFLVALILIYLIMVALFESFIKPIAILATVPGAAIGGLLLLILFRQKLNIISIVGLITLIGLITKHGIMLVDYIVNNSHRHILDEVILSACLARFRPIIMTTLCMVIGSIPLLSYRTEFHEYKVPIGLVIIGGMVIGTILTLYIVPCIYLIIEEIYQKRYFNREDYSPLIEKVLDSDETDEDKE